MVAAIRAEVPGAAVIVYHWHPVTPRYRVFYDLEHPRRHLSLGEGDIVRAEYAKLRREGRTVVLTSAQFPGLSLPEITREVPYD